MFILVRSVCFDAIALSKIGICEGNCTSDNIEHSDS